MMTVMGGVAEFQSAQTGEHIKKAQRQRVHLGLPIATRPPFGYDPPPPTAEGERQRGVPTPNATEALAVLQMFTMKANRITQRKIADWLNAEEFRTRNRHGDGQPRRFTSYSVRDILTNPFYVGKIRYNGEVYDEKHQAIVEQELFDAVQALRGSQPKVRSRGGAIGALKGLARCWGCGETIWSRRNWAGYALYQEPYHRDCATTGKSFRTTPVDAQIAEIFGALEFDPEVLNRMATLTVEARQTGPSADEISAARNRLAITFNDQTIEESEYMRRKAELDRQAQQIAPVADVTMQEAVEVFANFPALWAEATPEEQNRLLAPLVDAAWIDICTRRIAGLSPTPAFTQIVESATQNAGSARCMVLTKARAQELIAEARAGDDVLVQLVETPRNRTSGPVVPGPARLRV